MAYNMNICSAGTQTPKIKCKITNFGCICVHDDYKHKLFNLQQKWLTENVTAVLLDMLTNIAEEHIKPSTSQITLTFLCP